MFERTREVLRIMPGEAWILGSKPVTATHADLSVRRTTKRRMEPVSTGRLRWRRGIGLFRDPEDLRSEFKNNAKAEKQSLQKILGFFCKFQHHMDWNLGHVQR